MNYREKIKMLRDGAIAAVDRQKTLMATIEAAKRAFTAEEQTAFDADTAVVDAAERDIAPLESMMLREERAAGLGAKADAVRTPATIKAVTGSEPVRAEVTQNLTGGQTVGLHAIASALNLKSPRLTAYEHLGAMGYQRMADESQTMAKTFSTAVAGTADNLIFTPLSTDFIDTLRNQSLFLRGGPVPIDMSNGSIKIPGGNGATQASYTHQGVDFGFSQMTTRAVSMAAKFLRAMTSVDNYSVEISPLNVATVVGDDLSIQMSLAMDSAGLRGDGTGDNPSGIYTLIGAGQRLVVTTAANPLAPTLTEIDVDAKRMLAKYRVSNVPRRRPFWLMQNTVFTYLQFVRNSFGALAYPGLSLPVPTWYDNIPVLVSEQIPSNLGAGTNESELYLADFGHIMMGVASGMTMESSREASYVNGAAQLVSTFSRDETAIRAKAAHDFGMRYVQTAVVLTAVKWGK